jgi:hypothetical protein
MANLKVGKPDVAPDAPAHTPGIKMGNSKGNYERDKGLLPNGKRTARAATGINPELRDPIDPRMPNLTPGG